MIMYRGLPTSLQTTTTNLALLHLSPRGEDTFGLECANFNRYWYKRHIKRCPEAPSLQKVSRPLCKPPAKLQTFKPETSKLYTLYFHTHSHTHSIALSPTHHSSLTTKLISRYSVAHFPLSNFAINITGALHLFHYSKFPSHRYAKATSRFASLHLGKLRYSIHRSGHRFKTSKLETSNIPLSHYS